MTETTSSRRVLLIHPRKASVEVQIPHLGLASLAAVLGRAGHRVTVLDEVLYEPLAVPATEAVIAETQPDVIGVSTYTSTLDRTRELLATARRVSEAPILVGGPHATLFADDMAATGLADYVVRGEAEDVIVELVGRARRGAEAEIIDAPPPDVRALPWPDYSGVMNREAILTYPIMTSRGCPYQCNFCAVREISSHQWRPRDPADCVAEIAAARSALPQIAGLNVSDDCPTGSREHFKTFLRLLAQQTPRLSLVVDNMRADRVDEELVALMAASGARSVCLGVEHGNPEVFALVNKGETHDDIWRAATLVKRQGLELGLCFVIGLPGDTLRRTRDSIRFAQELSPQFVFWNLAHPFPGTEMHRYFLDHGATVDPPRTYTSYDTHSLNCPEPAVGTPDFTKWERQRAYFWAVLETDQYPLRPASLGPLVKGAWRYRMFGPALRSMARRTSRSVWRRLAGRLGRPSTAGGGGRAR